MYKSKALLIMIVTLTVVSGIVLLCSSSLFLAACPSADLSGDCFVDYKDFALMGGQWPNEYDCNDLTLMATEWLTEGIPDPNGMVWVYINDLGVPDHESFNGEMSKYEMTNAQYCQFLNAALDSNDITVNSNIVYGANGSNSGEDFVGQDYYNLAGSGTNWDGTTNGGAARIHYSGGVFTVDSGFENHPVTYVSWYGSTAFSN